MSITKQGLFGFAATLLAISTVSTAAQAKDHLARIDRTFLQTVSRANAAEIQAGNLALKRSRDPQVRQVAQTIVTQHSHAENLLQNVASKLDVPVPMSPDAKHQSIYRRLSRLSGRAFNRQYLLTQMRDHHAAINLFKDEMANGKHSAVRSFAATVLTDIYNHTKMIHNVAGGTYGLKTASINEAMPHHHGHNALSRVASSGKPLPLRNTMRVPHIGAHSFKPAPRSSPVVNPSPAPGLD